MDNESVTSSSVEALGASMHQTVHTLQNTLFSYIVPDESYLLGETENNSWHMNWYTVIFFNRPASDLKGSSPLTCPISSCDVILRRFFSPAKHIMTSS